MAENSQTNWLDVLKAGFWPLLALIALISFWTPLRDAVAGLEEVQSFKAGNLEVAFSVRQARQLPAPPVDVARALQSLSPMDRDALLSAGSPRRVAFCSPRGFASGRDTPAFRADPNVNRLTPDQLAAYVALSAAYERLGALQLAEIRRDFPSYVTRPEWCGDEFGYVQTTPLGDRTRSYLIDLINAGIQISSAD